MARTAPFLSVVMPVHQGAEWIGATLESLVAERCDDLEIIVIDSSESDDTADLVNAYLNRLPLTLLRRPDLKPWQVKTNFGVAIAAADHVCILHQDDLWLLGRLSAVRRWVQQFPDAALHLAPTRIIDRKGRGVGLWTCPLPAEQRLQRGLVLERLIVQNFSSVPAPVFLKSAWLSCGGMDPSLWYTADWDIWLKLAASGDAVYHQDVTTAFRVHGGSLTVTGSRDLAEFRSQMETVLDRHLTRLSGGQRRQVEQAAHASIGVNVSLAAVAGGRLGALRQAFRALLSLSPATARRYLRDSRLWERVLCRVRAKAVGAF
jgi:glycosyltransferase involved in cell wall biosynthesis